MCFRTFDRPNFFETEVGVFVGIPENFQEKTFKTEMGVAVLYLTSEQDTGELPTH